MTDLGGLLGILASANAEFIIVGGVAGLAHGAARLTEDLDVVYRRTPENIDRVATALLPLQPYLRGAPAGLPFRWDASTIRNGLNFTLITSAGAIDLLGEIAGGGTYEQLVDSTVMLEIFNVQCRCLQLNRLIEVKMAAGRPKDFEAIAELKLIADEEH